MFVTYFDQKFKILQKTVLGDIVQLVDGLPSTQETLGLIFSLAKQTNKQTINHVAGKPSTSIRFVRAGTCLEKSVRRSGGSTLISA